MVHPMQDILKYPDIVYQKLEILFNDSTSVNTEAPLARTKFEFGDFEQVL